MALKELVYWPFEPQGSCPSQIAAGETNSIPAVTAAWWSVALRSSVSARSWFRSPSLKRRSRL